MASKPRRAAAAEAESRTQEICPETVAGGRRRGSFDLVDFGLARADLALHALLPLAWRLQRSHSFAEMSTVGGKRLRAGPAARHWEKRCCVMFEIVLRGLNDARHCRTQAIPAT